jgi:hypothetical protein
MGVGFPTRSPEARIGANATNDSHGNVPSVFTVELWYLLGFDTAEGDLERRQGLLTKSAENNANSARVGRFCANGAWPTTTECGDGEARGGGGAPESSASAADGSMATGSQRCPDGHVAWSWARSFEQGGMGRRDGDLRHGGGPRGAVRADDPATGHGASILVGHLWFKQSPRTADYFRGGKNS